MGGNISIWFAKPAQTMADMFDMKFESNFEERLDKLEQGVYEHVLRSAAHAGAEIFYEEARRRAPVYRGPLKTFIRSGQLRDAIYRVFSESNSGETVKVYQVSWNHYKAPHGWWMEYGIPSKNILGKAYIRSSFDRANDAVRAMTERAAQRMQEVIYLASDH